MKQTPTSPTPTPTTLTLKPTKSAATPSNRCDFWTVADVDKPERTIVICASGIEKLWHFERRDRLILYFEEPTAANAESIPFTVHFEDAQSDWITFPGSKRPQMTVWPGFAGLLWRTFRDRDNLPKAGTSLDLAVTLYIE